MTTPQFAPTAAPGDTIFALAASGDTLYAARASGLYRSGDGGATWQDAYTALQRGERFAVTALAAAGDMIFAGATGTILRSDDGETWQTAPLPTPPPTVVALVVSPNFDADGLIAAGTAEDGVFVSTDRGASWVPWNFGLVDFQVNTLAISPSFAADRTIFAGTESGIFRSHNDGRSWRETAFPIEYAPVLSLSMAANGRLFAGTEEHGAFISDDFGATWCQIEQFRGAAVSAIQIEGARVWLLFDEALLVSNDRGETWTGDPRPLPSGKLAMALLPSTSGGAALVGFADGDLLRVP